MRDHSLSGAIDLHRLDAAGGTITALPPAGYRGRVVREDGPDKLDGRGTEAIVVGGLGNRDHAIDRRPLRLGGNAQQHPRQGSKPVMCFTGGPPFRYRTDRCEPDRCFVP